MVMKMRTNAKLRGMINNTLCGTRGPLEEDAFGADERGVQREVTPSEGADEWIGSRSVRKLAWLRFPDGTGKLVHVGPDESNKMKGLRQS